MGIGFSASFIAIPVTIILYLFTWLIRVFKKSKKENGKKGISKFAFSAAKEIGILTFLFITCLISIVAISFKDSGSFEKDSGTGDYWRVPLKYPYQLTMIDGLKQACLSKWSQNNSLMSCEIDAVTDIVPVENVVAGRADGKYFVLDLKTGALLRMDNIEPLIKTLSKIGINQPLQMKTVEAYYNDYWATH